MTYLTNFTRFKTVQGVLFLMIPAILWVINEGRLDSISSYVNHTPVAFTFMLTLASCLFIYDGFTHQHHKYNIYVGACLLMVIVLNHSDFPILHYMFAIGFFLGSLFNMIYYSDGGNDRVLKIILGVGIIFGMLGHYIFNFYSLFWAEWIGMFPIAIHFVLEELEH